jgi:hypothetical protein
MAAIQRCRLTPSTSSLSERKKGKLPTLGHGATMKMTTCERKRNSGSHFILKCFTAFDVKDRVVI